MIRLSREMSIPYIARCRWWVVLPALGFRTGRGKTQALAPEINENGSTLGLEHPNSDGENFRPHRLQRVKPTHMWNYLNWLQWLNHPNWFSGFCPPTCFRAGNCIKLMKVLKWPFKLCRTFGYLHLLVISTTSIWEYLISHQIKYK